MPRAIVRTSKNTPNIIQYFSTPGPGTYNASFYLAVSNATATAGATYTHNSVTYTVKNTISGASILVVSGNADPSTFGTLTKTGGTGDTTITFSAFYAPTMIKVSMVGAGGGGGGAANLANSAGGGGAAGGYLEKLINNPLRTYSLNVGTGGSGGGNGGSSGLGGGNTTFDGSTYVATGGGGGPGSTNTEPDSGGIAAGASGGDLNLSGGYGASGFKADAGEGRGGDGGASFFGGGGWGGHNGLFAAQPGGAIGSGGGGGGARAGGQGGASGSSGLIIVEEYF
jgi:hypothetical protein